MLTILVKSDDVRHGRKAKATCHRRLRLAQESMGINVNYNNSEGNESAFYDFTD